MLRQCPFDPVHVVQAYRYQRHILRCRKQNPEKAVDFRQCKFNAMHFFHKDKILQHEEECVDKARIERNRKIPAGKEFQIHIWGYVPKCQTNQERNKNVVRYPYRDFRPIF